jgi:hypothetical protein
MNNAIAQMVAQAPVAAEIVKADAAAKTTQRTKRAAQKPVVKKESAVVKATKVIGVKFQVTIGRPSSGRPLYGYTEAVLQLLGMYNGKHATREQLNKIMGSTAVGYHLTKTCTFEMTENGITLSEHGKLFFGTRRETKMLDEQDVKDWTGIMTTGQPDGRLIKNAAHIKAFA